MRTSRLLITCPSWMQLVEDEWIPLAHNSDVLMSVMASQITSLMIVCSTVCSGADQRKHQSSASLAFLMGIHWWPVNSPHKGPVTWKMFSFDDAIMHRLQRASNAESISIFTPTKHIRFLRKVFVFRVFIFSLKTKNNIHIYPLWRI